eukprot:2329426-Lingulodinium_polyedra.AAC.1
MAVRAVKAGTVSAGWWRAAVDAVGASAQAMARGGPVAAVFRAMRDLGLGQDFEAWAPTGAAPDGWRPLEQPRSATLRVLKAAWAAK